MTHSVAIIVGSLRRESFNRKIARAFVELAPASLAFEFLEIGGLPLYDQDLEDAEKPPAPWRDFREQVRARDAVLVVSPEYNRSIPGVLKNAIDVGSRPKTQNAWSRKPGAVITVSNGGLGGLAANGHIRQALMAVNVPVMPYPEAYIGNAATLLGPDGRLVNESTRDFLRKFAEAFARWVDTNVAR
ncbi:MAG TPA: NAD(P)H-dependent oxidoreductase [Gemmatimonadales bacterium]